MVEDCACLSSIRKIGFLQHHNRQFLGTSSSAKYPLGQECSLLEISRLMIDIGFGCYLLRDSPNLMAQGVLVYVSDFAHANRLFCTALSTGIAKIMELGCLLVRPTSRI